MAGKRPDYIAWITFPKRDTGFNPPPIRIGAAWRTSKEDGRDAIHLQLDAFPLTGFISLVEPKPQDEQNKTIAPSNCGACATLGANSIEATITMVANTARLTALTATSVER